jgi:acetyltransferase-like isoleucine patch superfamily enzyme
VISVGRLNKSILNRARQQTMLIRGTLTRALMAGFLEGGRGLSVGRNVALVVYGEIAFGDDVTLADGCALEVGPNGRLVLGDNSFVGRHSVIRAERSIELGSHCIIAEHCTVRDQDHLVDPDERRNEKAAQTAPIVLERNVWIGAGVRVLKGVRVGEGTVVAANAVVRGDVPPGVVVGGIPARILRSARAVTSASNLSKTP